MVSFHGPLLSETESRHYSSGCVWAETVKMTFLLQIMLITSRSLIVMMRIMIQLIPIMMTISSTCMN